MPVTETRYEHIILNAKGNPSIAGTKMSVVNLVVDRLAYGWSPEELHFQYPHITMGQIHSALAYYADHQEEIDKKIEHEYLHVEQLKAASQKTNLIEKLKAKKFS